MAAGEGRLTRAKGGCSYGYSAASQDDGTDQAIHEFLRCQIL
ncbi:hypothetical protein ABVB25_00710 [Streptomyces anthocyanicus]